MRGLDGVGSSVPSSRQRYLVPQAEVVVSVETDMDGMVAPRKKRTETPSGLVRPRASIVFLAIDSVGRVRGLRTRDRTSLPAWRRSRNSGFAPITRQKGPRTVYEIDFHPIEKTGESGSKSGDAITARFTDPFGIQRVIVVDGGYKHTGEKLVEHITTYYGTDYVDIVISTHPDADHINGLATVIDKLGVGQLLIHRPHDHAVNFTDYSNIEVIDALIGLAEEKDIEVVEPFTGFSAFAESVRVLGPTVNYYEALLQEDLAKTLEEKAALSASATTPWQNRLVAKAADLLDRAISYLPVETLSDDGQTSPRNSTSVITLLTVDGRRLLLSGDAGIESLNRACEYYERIVGEFGDFPLEFFQAPHHGSKRNLGPTVLNRLLGKPGDAFGTPTAFISSAKADPKHPSPKVTNALKRRGASVFATEGSNLLHHWGGGDRSWGPAPLIPALVEDDD